MLFAPHGHTPPPTTRPPARPVQAAQPFTLAYVFNTKKYPHMQTSTEQPFLPTAVNILRLRDYVLPPDGVVLFDWFVVKQACFRSGSFHYSQARIQAETRIARHRQDSLITQFCEWDFLVVFVNFNPATGGRVRFFSLDYAALADPGVLSHVVRKDSDLFAHYLNYFTHMSARLNTPKASTPTPAEEQAQAERVYHLLNRTFNERRKFYNLGGLTQGVRPVQPLPPTELPRNRAFVPRLARLGHQYSDDAICNSFGSYTDSLILGQKKVRSPLRYFLSYDDLCETFGVVDMFLDIFNGDYTGRPL